MLLDKNGALDKEIKDMMSALMADVPNMSTARLDILQKPTSFFVKPRPWRDNRLSVYDRDSIVVHAWKRNQDLAVAYNPETNGYGDVPSEWLEKDDPQPAIYAEICEVVPKINRNPFALSSSCGEISWTGGQKFRICRWQGNSRTWGVGFNMSTGEIGRFHANPYTLETLKEEDQLE
jgi:hypothetical protein